MNAWTRTEATRLVNLAIEDERQREADRRAVPRGSGRRSGDVAFITAAEMVGPGTQPARACWDCGHLVVGGYHICGGSTLEAPSRDGD